MRRVLATAFLALLLPLKVAGAEAAVSRASAAIDVCRSTEPGPCLGRLDAAVGGILSLGARAAAVAPAAVANDHEHRPAAVSPARLGTRITARQIVRRLPGRRVPRMDPDEPPAA